MKRRGATRRGSVQRPMGSGAVPFSLNGLYVIGSAIFFVVCHQIGLIRQVYRDESNLFQNSFGLLGFLANSSGSPNAIDEINGLPGGGLRPPSAGRVRRREKTEGGGLPPPPLVTALILTYSKPRGLEALVRSLADQELSRARLEVVVVDNGCQPETKRLYELASPPTVPSKFLPLCDNPGYAVGNNKGAELAAPDSKYILFLNDDIQLSSPDFIENMILLAESKPNAAAVGCKIVNLAGDELIEAGSIVFKGASAMGYGRGLKGNDIYRSDVSYPRPVDYVSGACLLIEKDVFMGYKHGDGFGFDDESFPNYYEDTDLQLHIQHDLQKEVWFQPKSIAKHEEHGSFGKEDSKKMMRKAAEIFQSKWEHSLEIYHVANPLAVGLEGAELDRRLLMAADVRARKTSFAKILYIDSHAPRRTRRSGAGRSFDNLSMLAELGHRITLVTSIPEGDEKAIEEITDLGVECYKGGLDKLVSTRAGFYDVVIVSRLDTFSTVRDSVKSMYLKHPFTLVYDVESMSFHKDERREEVMKVNGIQFPSRQEMSDDEQNLGVSDGQRFSWKLKQYRDISLVQTGDVVITISDQESKAISELLPNGTDVHTIGHVVDSSAAARRGFRDRRGILFAGDFRGQMNYNGDAIWYFLTEVYPLVIEKAEAPIPLKIVGREIPQQVWDTVRMNKAISQHVTFHESPDSLDPFMNETRVLIAPHLYCAGIHYQVSEALSNGLPVVMSRFTFDSFRKIPGCVGSDPDSMAQCVIDVHGDESAWASLQEQGLDFIEETHDREKMAREWSKVIDGSLTVARNRNRAFMAAENEYGRAYPSLSKGPGFQSFLEHYVLDGKKEGKTYSAANEIWNSLTDDRFQTEEPTTPCEEGERIYLKMYPDIAMYWKRSAFDHYKRIGKNEGRTYVCASMLSSYFETGDPTEQCLEGEILYFGTYPDVARDWRLSAFNHWQISGRNEGRTYLCFVRILDMDLDWSVKKEEERKETRAVRNGLARAAGPTKECPEGESIYLKMYPDVAEIVENGLVKSAFDHWTNLGKSHGQLYFCEE